MAHGINHLFLFLPPGNAWRRVCGAGRMEQREGEREEETTSQVYSSVSFFLEEEASAVIAASFTVLSKRQDGSSATVDKMKSKLNIFTHLGSYKHQHKIKQKRCAIMPMLLLPWQFDEFCARALSDWRREGKLLIKNNLCLFVSVLTDMEQCLLVVVSPWSAAVPRVMPWSGCVLGWCCVLNLSSELEGNRSIIYTLYPSRIGVFLKNPGWHLLMYLQWVLLRA